MYYRQDSCNSDFAGRTCTKTQYSVGDSERSFFYFVPMQSGLRIRRRFRYINSVC
ncbi:hypothetical protein LMG29542_08058 [Paraburkholderia humisilvae]|uniref:Uncharacterized protein n=1 Tax=Paraburkholderia humisilvae TaxID=627669 RepID=A0A6J5F715_9BURK|nr:hypothetical protein LMG29542_08058 [Paraburkholderia humisilvae]